MKRYQWYCPSHEWERAECGVECDVLRERMRRVNRDLCTLWYDRARGVPPATAAYQIARGRFRAALRDAKREQAA